MEYCRPSDTNQSSRTENSSHVEDPIRRFANFSSDQIKKSMKEFKEMYTTTTEKDERGIRVISENIGRYENTISIREGRIISYNNYKGPNDIWHLSEVVYHQWLVVMKDAGKIFSKFNLKGWDDKDVVEKKTKKTIEEIVPIGQARMKFYKDSEGFDKLAGTPLIKAKIYLVLQHPEAFPDKKLESIEPIRHPDGKIDINCEFG